MNNDQMRVALDPRVSEAEAKINQLEQERGSRLLNAAHHQGYQRAIQDVKTQQFLAKTNAILDSTVDQTLDLMPMPISSEERNQVKLEFLTDLNARCQTDPEIRGLMERGQLESATARVVSSALNVPDKIGQMVKLAELDESPNNGSYSAVGNSALWESAVQAGAMEDEFHRKSSFASSASSDEQKMDQAWSDGGRGMSNAYRGK